MAKQRFLDLHAGELIRFAERLNHAITLFGQADNHPAYQQKIATFAELLGIRTVQLHGWLQAGSKPSEFMIDQLAKELCVDPNWMESGIGHPLAKAHPISGRLSLPLLKLSEICAYPLQSVFNNPVNQRYAIDAEHAHLKCYVVQIEKALINVLFPPGTYFVIDPAINALEGDHILLWRSCNKRTIIGQYTLTDAGKFIINHYERDSVYEITARDKILGVMITALSSFTA